jgi:hypothetical protein
VQDEISYLHFLPAEVREFFNLKIAPLQLSYESNYPELYKIAGFSIFRDLDKVILERSTYDFLNFLGDVGGLDGVLVIVFFYLTMPAQTWNLQGHIAAGTFKQRKNEKT